jgi:hypothetical protein
MQSRGEQLIPQEEAGKGKEPLGGPIDVWHDCWGRKRKSCGEEAMWSWEASEVGMQYLKSLEEAGMLKMWGTAGQETREMGDGVRLSMLNAWLFSQPGKLSPYLPGYPSSTVITFHIPFLSFFCSLFSIYQSLLFCISHKQVKDFLPGCPQLYPKARHSWC